MNEAFELSSVRSTLRHMLEQGLLPSIECLDQPSPGWLANTRVDRRTFPDGYKGMQHQNLLRPSDQQLPPPGEELNGVTVFTNDHPIPPNLPF